MFRYIHTYIHTYMHACIHTDRQTDRHTCIYAYMHIHAYIDFAWAQFFTRLNAGTSFVNVFACHVSLVPHGGNFNGWPQVFATSRAQAWRGKSAVKSASVGPLLRLHFLLQPQPPLLPSSTSAPVFSHSNCGPASSSSSSLRCKATATLLFSSSRSSVEPVDAPVWGQSAGMHGCNLAACFPACRVSKGGIWGRTCEGEVAG